MLRAATRLLLVAGSAAIGAAGAIALRADLLVGYGFGKAFHLQKTALPFESTISASPLAKAEVGDEGYWLTRTGFDGQAPFAGHLAVGSRITISDGDGRGRTLEVVEIAPAGGSLLKVADDGAAVRLLRITARAVAGTPAAGRDEPVRFYVEVTKPKPAPIWAAPQAALGGT